jgi:hypothetical protein
LEILSAAILNAVTQNVVLRSVVLRIVAPQIAVLQNAVLRSEVLRSVVTRDVVPISVLNAVQIVAVIQALTPGRDARNADSREELHEELHGEFHPGLGVAEAQAVLQRRLVECWSQEQAQLLVLLA